LSIPLQTIVTITKEIDMPTTTPVQQKKDAVAAVTKKKPAPSAGPDKWKGIKVNDRVALATAPTKVIGTAKIRHTNPKGVKCVTVALAKPTKVNGRDVTARSFAAEELVAARETPTRKARAKAATDDRAAATQSR
jgi:hypothetical protein